MKGVIQSLKKIIQKSFDTKTFKNVDYPVEPSPPFPVPIEMTNGNYGYIGGKTHFIDRKGRFIY